MAKTRSIEERMRARMEAAGVGVGAVGTASAVGADAAGAADVVPCVLMVSGGADSTALACLFAEMFPEACQGVAESASVAALSAAAPASLSAGAPAVIVHVNHQLRGEAADADAAFVQALAARLGLPCVTEEVPVAALAASGAGAGNVEAAGRLARYAAARRALEALCAAAGMPAERGVVLTAHTADDRVENFYMRSIVGAGVGALRCLDAETRIEGVRVLRPLLDITHAELCAWLDARGHAWREDATNALDDGFRAYVRHHVVPAALARNPRLHETLARTMDLIADEDDYLATQADALARANLSWISDNPADGFVLHPAFGAAPRVLARRAVFAALTRVMRVAEPSARVEYAAVDAVLGMWDAAGAVRAGAVTNIQGNLAVSANGHGVRVEPMAAFRARRRKG